MHHPVEPESLDASLTKAAAILRAAKRVAVLTGAGISAESGLATFRGAGGLWEGHRVEEVATPRAFQRDPTLVWRFYNLRRANLATVKPNPGHDALVDIEKRLGDQFTLITQNVDSLHYAAGSKNVLEIHGALRRVRCTRCTRITERGTEALPDLPRCDKCDGLLRPDVVWFEEELPKDVWRPAVEAAYQCHCFLVVGTSAVVFPAAWLIEAAKNGGAKVIEVNLERSAASDRADVVLLGPSGATLPELIKRL